MALSQSNRQEIASELAARPGHEKVRTLVSTLLINGLGARSVEIDHEKQMVEARGRADALLGCTVFEFKRDLRRELADAKDGLSRYLADREKATGERYIGVACDGAEFRAFEMRDGKLAELQSYATDSASPDDLLLWFESVVAVGSQLAPDPKAVRIELGRDSVAYLRAQALLHQAWAAVRSRPPVALKRQLWSQLLALVHGRDVDQDRLFFQHTYLTVVAKAIAVCALDMKLPDAAGLLSGQPFREIGIGGAVESDFFDWVLDAPGGADFVERTARHVARFKLRDVRCDVLKTLYESLIDPEERHDLGEYYTPDWLAEMMCAEVIDRPLEQRVLDPACGSGSFVFHAARRYLEAAKSKKISRVTAIAQCTDKVAGMDVHPVAAILARVTYLLALGDLRDRPATLAIPIYLGEAMQWNIKSMFASKEIVIRVPPTSREKKPTELVFPGSVCEHPGRLDQVIDEMMDLSRVGAEPDAFSKWLQRTGNATGQDARVLVTSYRRLLELTQGGRDTIWGYVARNLSRPLWLSSPSQRADVAIGNPPWLSYRYMSDDLKREFKATCEALGIWVGGKLATHADLSGCFFARACQLYLKNDGKIAFVMPLAAVTRGQFEDFRKGRFPNANVRFTKAWSFDERVFPLFPVPSAILFAERDPLPGKAPDRVLAFSGTLPRRDCPLAEAKQALVGRDEPRPTEATTTGGSPYREVFRQGATLVPRMLCLVDKVDMGRLGTNPQAPVVRSRRSAQEKMPWKDIEAIQQTVEAEFLRPVYLGEDIVPFRLLGASLGVIPYNGELLTAKTASAAGFRHLARWLTEAEALWKHHGKGRITFGDRLNYYGNLLAQFPPAKTRVVYSKAGTLLAAAVLTAPDAVVDHNLYWSKVGSAAEGDYLVAILNSERLRAAIAKFQSRGQWGARHFDKYVFNAPIPKYDPADKLHGALVDAARRATEIAATVSLAPDEHFGRSRKRIREAFAADGIATEIDDLVARLLKLP